MFASLLCHDPTHLSFCTVTLHTVLPVLFLFNRISFSTKFSDMRSILNGNHLTLAIFGLCENKVLGVNYLIQLILNQ